MKNQFALGVTVSVLIVAGTIWGLFRDSLSGKKPAYSHLYCPRCDNEMIYDASKAGKKCPFCLQDGGGDEAPELKPAIGRGEMRVLASGVSATGKFVALIVVFLVVVQVDVLLWYWHQQERRRRAEAHKHRLLVCHCPFCKRKIGYNANRSGLGATCPRCKTAFLLPAVDALANAEVGEAPPAAS